MIATDHFSMSTKRFARSTLRGKFVVLWSCLCISWIFVQLGVWVFSIFHPSSTDTTFSNIEDRPISEHASSQAPFIHVGSHRVHVLTFLNSPYEPSTRGFFCDYVRTAFTHLGANVPIHVLGWWPNSSALHRIPQRHTREFFIGSKLTVLHAHLQQLLQPPSFQVETLPSSLKMAPPHGRPDDLILFSDSTDVIFQQPISHFIDAYEKCNGTICVSVEDECWPSDLMSEYHKLGLSPANAVHKYLNSGAFIGRLDALIQFLNATISDRPEFNVHELFYDPNGQIVDHSQIGSRDEWIHRLPPHAFPAPVYRRSDQAIISMLLFSGQFDIKLDYFARMFQPVQLRNPWDSLWWDETDEWIPHIVDQLPHHAHAFSASASTSKLSFQPDTSVSELLTQRNLTKIFRLANSKIPVYQRRPAGALHFNGPSKQYFLNSVYQQHLREALAHDAFVERFHRVYLVDRAWSPPQLDVDGVDFDSKHSPGIQRFDFKSCIDNS